ncbi:flagellar biosynthetic protein FliO, partial [Pantoea agglomerans]|uniref:flagellar biosynthetic protein FliO n=1 Tax=Enterobacter agglomerans TaxID=549 RepID=UPI001F5CA213
ASVSVGQRERVVIVDTADARLVLGVTAQQITHLHTLPPGDVVSTVFCTLLLQCFFVSVERMADSRMACSNHRIVADAGAG